MTKQLGVPAAKKSEFQRVQGYLQIAVSENSHTFGDFLKTEFIIYERMEMHRSGGYFGEVKHISVIRDAVRMTAKSETSSQVDAS